MSRAADLANLIASGSTTIHGEAGVTSSDSTGKTTNLQQGLCKSFWSLDGTGTIAFRGDESFNVSGSTDLGTGDYKVAFTNNMSSKDIQEILIRSANDLISLEAPNYQYAAARLLLWNVYKEVFG